MTATEDPELPLLDSISIHTVVSAEDAPLVAQDLPSYIWFMTGVVCLVNFTVGFSTSIIAPALIFIEESLDASVTEVSAIVSFALLGGLLGSVVAGWASDLVGRRPTLIFGAFVTCVAGFACAFSRTAAQLILSRFFQGLGTSIAIVVAGVLLTELSPTPIRGTLGSTSQNFVRLVVFPSH